MKSNFPGSEVQELHQEEIDALLEDNNGSFGLAQSAIASVSCVAALRDKSKTEDKAFIQGIERFIDAMDGDAYTALFLAEPVTEETQAGIRNGYEELYSALSPFRKTTWSYTENESHAVMETFCSGTSDTVTDGTSSGFSDEQGRNTEFNFNAGMNQGTTNTIGQSHAVTRLRLPGKRTMVGVAAGASILALGAVAASAVFPPAGAAIVSAVSTVGAAAVKAGPLFGSAVPMVAGHETNGIAWSTARSIGKALGFGVSRGYNTAHTDSSTVEHSKAHSTNEQHSHGTTETHGTARTQQIEVCNKAVEELLTRIDEQIKRTKESEDYGCYSCAAYFLSSRPSKALLAANTYRSLMIGEGSSVESGAVNLWQDRASVTAMREYLKRFTHPVFARQLWENEADSLFYTAGTLVSGRELPMHLGLPTRSVHGLPVIEHAEFGRNVPDAAIEKADKIDLGKIYHMGQPESADLILSRQAMAAHTFITGSTGTGKSNAVYHLLDELTKDGNTTFLVVEPAKGEYKTVFGNGKAAVYGTNPRETPLLRLNPFAFPAEIHVLEHIDRLVEIFSACWPMYAAMPAVLKDAIERSYQNAGWDLRESESERGVFPTFFDLLRVLPTVIEESHYSNDTQSDYVGALCTRVKSLTNGIYGSVFCAEDVLSDAELFDENVIVDLSRASAMETKSLLMGILVMKLQEYRMCSGVMNGKLRHVTVLEEAHNLLRKTSAEQVQESVNVQGKSVEMLANAIAEMRTYGEGFIVADQAPGLLDVSVIRNTNTKIILRLPDEEDRKLVGKSAGLKEAQIDELSKLPLGVAAVYQNEWPEAVLCKMKPYPMPESAVYHKPVKTGVEINTEFIFGQLAQEAPAKCLNDSEMEQLKRWLKRHEIWMKPEERRYIEQVFQGELKDRDKTQKMVFDFFGGMETLIQYCYEAEKTLTPRRELVNQLQGRYALQTSTAEWALNCLMTEGLQRNPDRDAAKELRKNFLEQGGKVM